MCGMAMSSRTRLNRRLDGAACLSRCKAASPPSAVSAFYAQLTTCWNMIRRFVALSSIMSTRNPPRIAQIEFEHSVDFTSFSAEIHGLQRKTISPTGFQ